MAISKSLYVFTLVAVATTASIVVGATFFWKSSEPLENALSNNGNNQQTSRNTSLSKQASITTFEKAIKKKETIRIATVICSANHDSTTREEAAVMIKSVVISTILHEISSEIEFHLFVEHIEDIEYFRLQLKQFGYPFTHAKTSLRFYSAIHSIPKQYQKDLINSRRFRCMYVRIFLPNILPEYDSIAYLDTDIIITGNLEHLWSHFSKMNNKQLVAIAQDIPAKSPRTSSFFKGIPTPVPKGLNSGVQLMNLTKMRNYNWEEKLLRVYQDYGILQNISMTDQKLINILLYYDSGLFFQLPCQFNFWDTNCLDGFYCDEALQDPLGIQVIHGANSSFDAGKTFNEIFAHYRDFPLDKETSIGTIKSKLMIPIRKEYEVVVDNVVKNRRHHYLCDGAINLLLFKSLIDENLPTI